MNFVSNRQRLLFEKLESAGELVFACGDNGISANIVGEFKVRKNKAGEDQLDMGDGKNHIHIDWTKVERFEVDCIHGEGRLTFLNQNQTLFCLYRMEGPYSNEINNIPRELTNINEQ
jgi:hypothetical protein